MSAATRSVMLIALAAGLLGCRPGLPPEPPGQDPADPDAPVPAYEGARDPFTTSAFEGERLGESSGHEGHSGHGGHGGHSGHSGHGKAAKPAEPAEPAEPKRHDHGAKKPEGRP